MKRFNSLINPTVNPTDIRNHEKVRCLVASAAQCNQNVARLDDEEIFDDVNDANEEIGEKDGSMDEDEVEVEA